MDAFYDRVGGGVYVPHMKWVEREGKGFVRRQANRV